MSAVETTRDGAVATVTLNRPDTLNAPDRATRCQPVVAAVDGPALALALALTECQVRAVGEVSSEAAAIEARHQGEAAAHPDHVEGRSAFTGKRAPRWA